MDMSYIGVCVCVCVKTGIKSSHHGGNGMIQRVKVLAVKPGDLSSIP